METNPVRGIFCMLGAMLFISVQEALAKYLGEFLPVTQVVWARYSGHLLLMVVWLWPKHGRTLLKSEKLSTQVGRSLILLIDTVLFFFGLTMLGLAEATAIFFTVPLLVLLISIPLLGERVKTASMVAIVVGFMGTLIIVRPGLNDLHSAQSGLGALCIFAVQSFVRRKLAGPSSSSNCHLPVARSAHADAATGVRGKCRFGDVLGPP